MTHDEYLLETPPQFQDDDEAIHCKECKQEMEYNRISNVCNKCIENENTEV
jgi:hypothetical protein